MAKPVAEQEIVVGLLDTGTGLMVDAGDSASESVRTIESALISSIEFNVDNNPVYVGYAVPGSATSAAVWQIRKFTYVGTNPTAIRFAGGSRLFNAVWDDRASLSYS